MKLSRSILILLCLSLLGACSTKRALIKTDVLHLKPNDGLLVSCPPPKLRPSKTNADIVANSLERQTAYETCNIYHQCLIDWHKAAEETVKAKGKTVAVPSTCGSLIQ